MPRVGVSDGKWSVRALPGHSHVHCEVVSQSHLVRTNSRADRSVAKGSGGAGLLAFLFLGALFEADGLRRPSKVEAPITEAL